MRISKLDAKLLEEATNWRREMHQTPQTAYEEEFASDLVRRQLTQWGIPFEDNIAVTGIVATIEGKTNNSGRSIGLRADMDALDITEASGQPWSSQIPGKMHGCGHDGHTAMLLGAAKLLKDNPDFDGTVYLIFQPAEEGNFGAHKMIEEGLFERFPADEVYALHTLPDIPAGHFATCPGMILAASDRIEIKIHGEGGHAAMPHLAVDPVLIAGHIIVSLQSIISRRTDPMHSVVISLTNVVSGTGAHNVIPDGAWLYGTVRLSDSKLRPGIERQIRQFSEDIAAHYGGRAEVKYHVGFEATINTKDETDYAVAAARSITDTKMVYSNYPATLGGEDFGAMLEQKPGCYMYIGQGKPDEPDSPYNFQCHASRFDFNDDALAYGIVFWQELVRQRLEP